MAQAAGLLPALVSDGYSCTGRHDGFLFWADCITIFAIYVNSLANTSVDNFPLTLTTKEVTQPPMDNMISFVSIAAGLA
jgi:hypothetical protein